MKKLYLFLLLSMVVAVVQAQDTKTEISTSLTTYFDMVKTSDYEAVVDYLHPKIFEFVPKEALVQAMQSMNEDEDIQVGMDDFKITTISDILKNDGNQYALVHYDFKMFITFKEEEEDKEDDAMLEFMLTNVYTERYGEENVSFDDDTNTFTILAKDKQMYAIMEKDFDDWKYLENKPELVPILEIIIPKEVMKKL